MHVAIHISLSVLLSAMLMVPVNGKAPCNSPIYCQGDILHAVQMAKLFPDDKTFVDKPTSKSPSEVLKAFEEIGGLNATKEQIRQFVNDNFGEEGSELNEVELSDFKQNPGFLKNIKDPLLKAYGSTINGYWSDLIREQDLSAICKECATSMLPIKYHFVVPGGRFREMYYWDTYFTLEGMLLSELTETAKSTIQDLLYFVDEYGFVPNGARVYYLNRSQPPFLSLMINSYYEHTNDTSFVEKALPLLKKEHEYWLKNHSVQISKSNGTGMITLSRYTVDNDQPRPESYTDDYELATSVSNDTAKQAQIYADMATGAESGWDYTVRWVTDSNAQPEHILDGIRTRQVIPVELNVLLYQSEIIIAKFDKMLNNGAEEQKYREYADTRANNMIDVFYNETNGMFFDWFIDEGRNSDVWSPASIWPYWLLENIPQKNNGSENAFNYLDKVLSDNPGGVPATLYESGQQWDSPMAWPPLQYVLMQSALKNNQKLALRLAQTYVNTAFCSWYKTGGSIPDVLLQLPEQTDKGHMFEKYNSTGIGQQGGGGEYTVQAGFGWTNGVLIWALDKFGNDLKAPTCPDVEIKVIGDDAYPKYK